MSICFDKSRWEEIRRNYKSFFNGTLERPVISITLKGYENELPEPSLPLHKDFLSYDFSIPAEEIVDVLDYHFSKRRYFGDAFPLQVFRTPTVAAAFLGGKVEIGDSTIWMKSPGNLTLSDTSLKYDAANIYWKRTVDLYRAAVTKWGGSVLLGMPSLGANMDLIMPFFSNEILLMSIYDEPDSLKRLLWEVHGCWWKYFQEINGIIQDTNPGYSSWAAYYSDKPTYILQCDFAAMIGPDTFKEMIMPELEASAKKLANVYFHLDGPDMVKHLDMILEMPDISGVQWIPGPKIRHSDRLSIDIHKRIRNAGKNLNIAIIDIDVLKDIEVVVDALGSAKGMFMNTSGSFDRKYKDTFCRFLEKFGVPMK